MCEVCSGEETLHEYRDVKRGQKAQEEVYQYIDGRKLITEIHTPFFQKVLMVDIKQCPICGAKLKGLGGD